MTFKVSLSPHAEEQLDELFEIIATDSGFERAEKFVGSLIDYCLGFNTFPERGARRDDIRPGIRIVGFHRRAGLAFTVEGKNVVFLGTYYGGHDFESDLKEDSP